MLYKQSILIFISVALAFSSAHAQVSDYPDHIQKLYSAINTKLADRKTGLYYETDDIVKNENPHSWLWPLCAYIQATNEMEVIDPGKNYMLPVEKAIDQYYNKKPPGPAYQDYVFKEK